MLMPWISRFVFERVPVSATRRTPLALALAQLRGAPGQAMVSLAAIVASFSLMVAMAIMVASFRESVDRWLAVALPADLYFRTTSRRRNGLDFTPSFQDAVRRLQQLERVEFIRFGRVVLDPLRPAVSLIARDTTAMAVRSSFRSSAGRTSAKKDDPPPAWVSEAVADRYGFAPGDRITLPLAGARHSFVVAGVWRDYARQHGAIVIERAVYAERTATGARTTPRCGSRPALPPPRRCRHCATARRDAARDFRSR
jgi:putative ABC transport system permease protein